MPSESEQTILDLWRQRAEELRAHEDRKVDARERELERIQKTLALENMLSVAAALVREADELRESGASAEAVRRCQTATRLAPRFNAGWTCLARASLSDLELGQAVGAAGRALSATLDDVRSHRVAMADEVLSLLAGILLAASLLILLLSARAARLVLHDFHHLLPHGAVRWQSGLLLALIVVLPPVLGAGLVASLAVAAAAAAFLMPRPEAIAAAATCLVALLAGAMVPAAVRGGSFGPIASDIYLLERGDAPAAAAARLHAALEAGRAERAGWFALGRYHKRMGKLEQAEAAYEQARKGGESGDLLNNLGNVAFLRGDSAGAHKLFREANGRSPALAAPLYNLAKLYFREGSLEQGNDAQKRALEVGGDEVLNRGFTDDLRANRYLMDVALPDTAIETVAQREAAETGAGGTAWRLLAGRRPGWTAFALLLAAAACGASAGLRRRARTSTACEKCGRPVCSRCDPEIGSSGGGLCSQCVTVFVRRTGADKADKMRKEIEVRRHRRREWLTQRVMVVVAGAGHVWRGQLVTGAMLLSLFSLAGARVLLWHGFLGSPAPVESTSLARLAAWAAVLAALDVLAALHLRRSEGVA